MNSMTGPAVGRWDAEPNSDDGCDGPRLAFPRVLIAVTIVASAATIAWGAGHTGVAAVIVALAGLTPLTAWITTRALHRHLDRALGCPGSDERYAAAAFDAHAQAAIALVTPPVRLYGIDGGAR